MDLIFLPELRRSFAAATEVLGCICIALGLFTAYLDSNDFHDERSEYYVYWKHGWGCNCGLAV
ncbi:hypothetical protein O9993_22775 [Vibrio lentus]|nr:hypothetical protein [Vibrio lentus]